MVRLECQELELLALLALLELLERTITCCSFS